MQLEIPAAIENIDEIHGNLCSRRKGWATPGKRNKG